MKWFLVLLLIVSFFVTSVYAQSPTVPQSDYVPNEIVVKYRDNLSPESLAVQVNTRQQKTKSFLGRIQLFWGDLKLTFARQEKPEVRLSRLQSIDKELGIIDKQLMPESSNQIGPNLYLLKTDGSKTIDDVVRTYETLPEVEYAEPNVIYQPFDL